MRKAIYQPTGKAGEYAVWACNLFVGCSHNCSYCYCKQGVLAHSLGGDHPTLKKSVGNNPLLTFKIELTEHLEKIQDDGGIFFSFTTDPMQHETIDLTMACAKFAVKNDVEVTILTKAAWWDVDDFIKAHADSFVIGFTLTGHDELEPGADPNIKRIEKMREVQELGVSTFASCEPIIDFGSTLEMIRQAAPYCGEFRIGLLSGVNTKEYYERDECLNFVDAVKRLQDSYHFSIYWKDSMRDYLKDDAILNCAVE